MNDFYALVPEQKDEIKSLLTDYKMQVVPHEVPSWWIHRQILLRLVHLKPAFYNNGELSIVKLHARYLMNTDRNTFVCT